MLKILLCLLFVSSLTAAADVTINKKSYVINEDITVTFPDEALRAGAWVGIYPKSSSNDLKNTSDRKWITAKTMTLSKNISAGEYEVRVFYNSSTKLEFKKDFTIKSGGKLEKNILHLKTNKSSYYLDENITVTLPGDGIENRNYSNITNLMLEAKRGSNKKVKYIVTGDSTRHNSFNKMIEYYRKQLKRINVRVYNNAEGGQRAENWLKNRRYATIDKALSETEGLGENTILEYSFGLNDYKDGRTLESTKESIKKGLEKYMKLRPKTKIILVSPVATTGITRDKKLRKIYGELAHELKLPLIDASIVTRPLVGNLEFYQDSVHPTVKGSQIIADYILKELSNDELRESLNL